MKPPFIPPRYQFNGHIQTIFPSLFRKVNELKYERERIDTPDGDFLDLDWVRNQPSEKLIIVSHGLEGDASRAYVKGLIKAFTDRGFHGLGWNFRGCSGEMNRKERFYHSGATDDLALVIAHALKSGAYKELYLAGFSLGGNLTLKYLGEPGRDRPAELRKAVTFSVPLDLSASCKKIGERSNYIYSKRFLTHLSKKIRTKAAQMPESFDTSPLKTINTLKQFDDEYTAPLHGFKDAEEYYARCSALQFLADIKVPTLILSAKNDPFLSPECFPEKEFKNHPFVTFEAPEQGGHVGFAQADGSYYSEERAVAFIFEDS